MKYLRKTQAYRHIDASYVVTHPIEQADRMFNIALSRKTRRGNWKQERPYELTIALMRYSRKYYAVLLCWTYTCGDLSIIERIAVERRVC